MKVNYLQILQVMKYILCLWVVLWPNSLEFIEVVWTKNGPITCQVVKVIHDDGHEQIDDLEGAQENG